MVEKNNSSVVDGVVTHLMEAILEGRQGPGSRLAAERELTTQLGASRVSVRSALRRLAEWGVVVSRHGSGASVLPRRVWRTKALAAVLRFGFERGEWRFLAGAIVDAMELRRALVADVVRRAAGRVEQGSLGPAREAVDHAWEARRDAAKFTARDRDILPIVLEIAGMYPSLWLINSLAEPYLAVMEVLTFKAPVGGEDRGGLGETVPEHYSVAHAAMLDAIEAGDGDEAVRQLETVIGRRDELLIEALPEPLRVEIGALSAFLATRRHGGG